MFKKIAASVAIAVTAGLAPATLTASPASAAPCPIGTWSSTAQGRPASLAPGSSTGMYMWHDSDGWHVRVTHPGHARVRFTGLIDSVGTGPFDVATVATESNDVVVVNPLAGRIRFRMENRGRIDGFDFKVGCVKRFSVSAQIDGAPIANSQVYLGVSSANPTSVPFVMERS